MYCKMRYRIRLLYENIHSGSAHPPAILCGYSYARANTSALHIVTPLFIAPPPRRGQCLRSSTSSRRRSYGWLSQKAVSGRSCHYAFRRLAVNRSHAIRFFRRLASRQPHAINSDEVRPRILEQISGF